MKNLLLAIFATFAVTIAWGKEGSPIGYWKTIDDVTGQPKAIVEIWEAQDKTLYGKVRKIFTAENSQIPVCKDCPGEKRNQPILGLTILEDVKPHKEKHNEWQNGSILDPKNGKSYHCDLRLAANGEKLQVRGYVGVPLFGRTQTWEKVKASELA